METILNSILSNDPAFPWHMVLLSMVMSFILSMVIAVVYVRTYNGLSYSRSYVQSLVLGAIVATMLMLAIGNNLVRGIGIMGTLALIRFRSTMKDPRDMIFIFAALAAGIASGTRAYFVGVIGVAVFSAATYLLRYTEFGVRHAFDGMLRLQIPAEPEMDIRLKDVLRRHCRNFVLAALREVAQGQQIEHNYQIRLKTQNGAVAFVREIESLPGARAVSFFLQEANSDV